MECPAPLQGAERRPKGAAYRNDYISTPLPAWLSASAPQSWLKNGKGKGKDL